MSLDDRIRDAMTAHEHEAPAAAEFRVRPAAPHTRTRWLPVFAAASVVLAVVGAVVAIRSSDGDKHSTPPAAEPLSCPQTYLSKAGGEWVPALARGVDDSGQLVPQQTPTRVLLCAYERRPTLTGSKELTRDLSAVASALTWLPRKVPGQERPCQTVQLPTDGDAYLVGLTYPGGTVWVNAPGDHCAGASNGRFATPANLRAPVASAFATGRWTVNPTQTQSGDHDPCHVGTAGRLGQQESMVPGKPISATLCKVPLSDQSSVSATKVVTEFGPLMTAMNALPTSPSSSGCAGLSYKEADKVIYEALFGYADGPPVFVRVSPGCHPSIDNLSLQADDDGVIAALIQGLLGGR